MQAAPNPRLDRLLVHYFEHAQDLVNIFRLGLHPLMISDGVRALEMIRQLGLLELLIFCHHHRRLASLSLDFHLEMHNIA